MRFLMSAFSVAPAFVEPYRRLLLSKLLANSSRRYHPNFGGEERERLAKIMPFALKSALKAMRGRFRHQSFRAIDG